jgi:hypothetical protein
LAVGPAESGGPLTTDEAAFAKWKGWTAAEMRAFARSEQAVGEVAIAVAEEQPDQFVGSALSEDPFGPPTLYVKGPADEAIDRLVAASSAPITVADNQPYSRDELDVQTAKTARILERLGYDEVGVYADIKDRGTIVVVAGIIDDSSASALSSTLAEAVSWDVSLRVSGHGEWSDFAVMGGLQSGDAVGPKCTTGFTVNRIAATGATRGVLGAGHCTGINQIFDHVNNVFTSATLQEQHIGFWGDFEWYGTPAAEIDDFYADVNDRRDVSSVEPAAGISLGEGVCLFGWGSIQHACSSVAITGWSCLSADRLVLMTTNVGAPGDSGGPWFFNNRAYGVEKGVCDSHAVFSIADYADEAVHAAVATT